jgi:3',5'-cyclic AMP phosphodiesterase CpdA
VQPAPWLQGFWPGKGSQGLLARRILEKKVDLVLHLGDLVYPWGRWEHYALAVFEPFRDLLANADFRPTLGNHDLITERGGPLFRAFLWPKKENRYYSFTRGPVLFLCLDAFSSSIAVGSPQFAWLNRTLEQSKEAWKVVFLHRPFFTASRSRKDAENDQLRTLVHPVFARTGVTLVLSGHDHVYERYATKDGVHYAVAGGGGKNLYLLHPDPMLLTSCRCFSFVLVDAKKEEFSFQAFSIQGTLIDSFEVKK